MRRPLALLLLTLTAALGGSAVPAFAGDLGALPGPLLSDGSRYVMAGGASRVFDARTSRWQAIDVPAGCSATGLSRGKVLFTCVSDEPQSVTSRGSTLDLSTGAVAALPDVRLQAEAVPVASASYTALGDRWAQLAVDGSKVFGPRFVALADGRFGPGPQGRREVIDLDRVSAARPLCRPVARPLQPQFIDLVPGPLVLSRRRAAAVHHSNADPSLTRVVLQGCGRKPTTVRRCVGMVCGHVVLDGRVLAWTETRDEAATVVRVRSLQTRRTRRVTAPDRAELALVRHRLYIAGEGRLQRITP